MRRLAIALALLVLSLQALAQADVRQAEIRIKAAFLYKFGDFVEWPSGSLPQPPGAFTIGVLGSDAMAAELERAVAGRTVHGHPVEVRRLHRGDAFTGLHVLFVGQGESARLAEVLAGARGRPLLLVTESEDALALGSMINFVAVEDKVRFDVAPASAEQGKLRISSRLLGVARKVVPSS